MSPAERSERRGKVLRRLGALLLALGVLGGVEVALTVFWQEPFSSWAAKREQDAVGREVAALLARPVPATERRRLASLPDDAARRRARARELARRIPDGKGLGRIEVPAIDVDLPFVEGTRGKDLERGPGHFPKTDLPGDRGTVAIAGHRTTYGAPFRHIDSLERGDRIVVRMPYGTFTYRVERLQEVTPDRVDVVQDVGYPRLVLSACTPLFSSARRIIVFARLQDARD